MAKQEKFDRADYTAIVANAGNVLKEELVKKLQDKKLLPQDEQIKRMHSGDKRGYAIAVFVKTSTLKKAIEKDTQLVGLLVTENVSLSDIVRKSFRLGSGLERSIPVAAERYVRKTHENKSTFFQDRQQSEPSSIPDWLKKWAPTLALVTVIGGGTFIIGRVIRPSIGLANGVATSIEGASEFNSSGSGHDRQDDIIQAHSGVKILPRKKPVAKPAESHQDKETDRQNIPADDKAPGR